MKKLLFLLFLSSLVACARPPYVVPDSVDTSHIVYDDSSSVVNQSTSTSNVGEISTSFNKVDLGSLNYISTCDFFNKNTLLICILYCFEYRLMALSLSGKTPRVGLEPTTTRLTAECSTIELSRIN